MRALLLYNPMAGRHRDKRADLIRKIADQLRSYGYEADVLATTHAGSAADQVRLAIASGVQVVFACGGDGTVHEVLQGLVGTDVLLAVIPMGSANALCRELRIPLSPMKAAGSYRHTRKLHVPLSRCEDRVGRVRYFFIMAGAGADGALAYRMQTTSRSRWGRWAYLLHAVDLLLRGTFPQFQVWFRRDLGGSWRSESVISMMALRSSSLGGIFPGIARGASLLNPRMKLVLAKGPAMLSLPLWFFLGCLHLDRWNPLLVTTYVEEWICEAGDAAIQVQNDGEWLGTLPVRGRMLRETVQILIPN